MKLNDAQEYIRSGYENALKIRSENLSRGLFELIEVFRNAIVDYSDSNFISEILFEIGSTYDDLVIYESALDYYQKALDTLIDNNNLFLKARIFNGLGIVYNKISDYSESLKNHFKSLELKLKLDNDSETFKSYNNISVVYKNLKNYELSIKYCNFAYDIAEKSENLLYMATVLNNIGLVYSDLNNNREALEVHKKALDLAIKLNNRKMIADSYNNVIKDYLEMGKYKKAHQHCERALKFYLNLGDRRGEARILYITGSVLINLNEENKGLQYLNQAMSLAKELDYMTILQGIYNEMSRYYYMKTDYKKACDYKNNEMEVKKLINLSEIREHTANIEKSFEVIRKEKENEIFRLKNIELAELNEKLKRSNLIKDKLFSIISHDLKNPLSVIMGYAEMLNYGFVDPYDPKAKKFIKDIYSSSQGLSTLISNLLVWSKSQISNQNLDIKLNNLIESIDLVINQLNGSLQNKNIEIVKYCDNECSVLYDKGSMEVVLRNILSNAIKFSYPESEIIISCEYEDDCVKLSIKDFGMGMTDEQIGNVLDGVEITSTEGTSMEKGTGLGLILCRDFVHKNGGEIFFEKNIPNGMIVSIVLRI
ncbi:MAG: tetratricopeptide repeat-containing sensor histidine kinase [Candidatus Delongbacteria bacterium]|nr:tetratricopeptide repeat-containing sensor histidine kinase [Candidatus Delongbacteria bacterium]MBN2834001.1 tetratricopeptide repeat-containing sensor histidine kinase [Candidatus Delongbacteria bacterium]